jgi:plasmid stabilization system protein ParE
VTARKIRFTATAQRHIDREKAWWLEHRDHTEVFAAEFTEAFNLLAYLPGSGTPYARASVIGLRRVYLQKIGCHTYYTFDDNEVIIRAVWGARRRRGPGIRP